jgi:hypothetical protein
MRTDDVAITVIYRINYPYSPTARIEVYGEGDMGWYEWRVLDKGAVLRDTGRDNNGSGIGYGSPEIALRDALNDAAPPEPNN